MSTSNTICGYVVITDHWFKEDKTHPSQSFKVEAKAGKVVFNKSLQDAWRHAIQPQCRDPNSAQSVFSVYDVKRNPRRFHPFATAFIDWYRREIPDYVKGNRTKLPTLILQSSSSNHDLLNPDVYEDVRKGIVRSSKAHDIARIIQRWWRSFTK